MARKVLILDEENRKRLKRVVDRGTNWRERQRAQTLLLLGEGMLSKNVAHQFGIHARTVGTTRSEWLASGMASLADRPRSGAPRKLKPEHVQRLLAWATAQPLTAPALLAYHKEQGGPCVHLNTLRNVLRLVNLVWKRTRHSLKNSRNEAAFRQAAVEIAALREQAAAGEIELAYADEAGFACVHPNRSAWTPVGGRHLIEAKRGKRNRSLPHPCALASGLRSDRLASPGYAGMAGSAGAGRPLRAASMACASRSMMLARRSRQVSITLASSA